MKHFLRLFIIIAVFILLNPDLPIYNGESYGNVLKNNTAYFTEKTELYIDKSPPSYQVYYYIKKYCKIYGVPEKYAFRVAKEETGWKGPMLFKYNPYQSSCTNALGPMQVLLSTSKKVWCDNSITEDKLKTDIKFNIHTSIKYMRQLYDIYENWQKVYSHYNTGYPNIVNEYVVYVMSK